MVWLEVGFVNLFGLCECWPLWWCWSPLLPVWLLLLLSAFESNSELLITIIGLCGTVVG